MANKRNVYSRKLPDYSQPSKAEMRKLGQDLVAKYLRAKKKGQVIHKIKTGRITPKSYAWR